MPRKILVVLYGHPEAYPPTLNALTQLSKSYDRVSVLYRPLLPVAWDYAANVSLYPSGKPMEVREQERLSLLKRISLFLHFTLRFYRLCRQERPDVVLLYDALPVFAYFLIRKLGLGGHLVWYHNHDVLGPGQKKFSLNWWAYHAERKVFADLDIFSLPAQERRQYFPMDRFKGRYFFLPNWPSAEFFRRYRSIRKDDRTWRIIFQGHIDRGHAIEEIMQLMPRVVNGRPLQLVLKGWIRQEYRDRLEAIARERGLEDLVEYVGYTAYEELPKLTASCHIGIAIHAKDDIMNRTLGTASNKIYEYAAVGLPVLYYDNEHFNTHLKSYDWAVPTAVDAESLLTAIEHITANFPALSAAAKSDFEDRLNYEHHYHELGRHLANGDGVVTASEDLMTAA